MAPLRNAELWKGTASSGTPATVYTVPAGKLVVVKSVNAQNTSGSSSTFGVQVDTLYVWSVVLAAYNAAGSGQEWRPWLAVPAGSVLKVFCSSGHTVDVVISGSIYFV
jgi:hypothetical protein